MNKTRKTDRLPAAVALLGALSWGVRTRLYETCVDEKGLLLRGHPLELGLWLCAALAAAAVLWSGRKLPKENTAELSPSPALTAALGHILAAAGILLTVLPGGGLGLSLVQKLWRWVGILCAPLLVWGAFSRALGRKPFFGIYAAASVFFALHLVCHYQLWCADPQLQNYVFSFLGAMLLMVFAYSCSARWVGAAGPRLQYITGLLAVYLCLTAASAGAADPWLYLGCGLWALTGFREKAGGADASS